MQTFERLNHGSGVFFPNEIMDILQAVFSSSEALHGLISDTPESRAWFAGRDATLDAIAQGFGLAFYSPAQYGSQVMVVTPMLASGRRP